MKDYVIKEVDLKEALKVYPKIDEWDRPEASKVDYCDKHMSDKRLILGAYINDEIIGYLLAYEKNNSFYCWITAVDKKYRRMGILTDMMNLFIERAKKLNFKKVTLKTVNNKREMLSYIVKNNWYFTDIIRNQDVRLNEIRVEKEIN